MTKVIIISDSHGSKKQLKELVLNNSFDFLFFLGDGISDLKILSNIKKSNINKNDLNNNGINKNSTIKQSFKNNNNDFKIIKVAGNCDYFCEEAEVSFENIEDFKLLLTHGHKFRTKFTSILLLDFAKQNYCDIVLSGHTHKQSLEKLDGIIFLNPGAFKNGQYAIMTLEKNCEPKIELLTLKKLM